MKRSTRSTGFTIVELLIVIVVIGILAAITIVAYNGVQTRAKNTSVQSDIKNVQKQVEAYNALKGSYPSTGSLDMYVPTLIVPSLLIAMATKGQSGCRISRR